MAIDERNFRSAYYEKVGFKNVEEKRSIEILLKERHLDLSKLRQFCLRFGVPVAHRTLVWKLLLGIIPVQDKCQNYVLAQRKEEYNNLVHALNVMRVAQNVPKEQFFVALWLLQQGKLNFFPNFENQRALIAIVQCMMTYLDCEVDVFWMSKTFFETVQKFQSEVPKLIEITHQLLEKEDPNLYKYLVGMGVMEVLPLRCWYECCFAGVLSDSTLARIWDKIAGGSYKILIYTTVVLLTTLKNKMMMKGTNAETVMQIVNNISEEVSEVIAAKSVELWQHHGSPLTINDKPKP